MNTTTSPDPFVDPSFEVWAARLTSYLGAMGMVLLQYDCLLTLNDEVRLVWPGPLSIPKVLYYLNRYLSFFAMIFCNYQVSGVRPPISDNVCKAWIVVSGIALPISTSSSTALLTLRATALYRHVRWFTPLLWIAFVLFQGLRSSTMLFASASLYGSLEYSPVSNVCVPTNTSYRSAAPLLVPGIYDFLLLGLTLVKGVKSAVSLRAGSGSQIMFTLIRDELLYFFIISSLRIFNSVVWTVLSPGLIGLGLYAEWGLESTLTSRFFLNLRSIAFHQPQTTQGIPSTIPAIRTRRAWQQQGPTATNFFVDLDTDKFIDTDGTKPKDGSKQETETFSLRVITPQTQHNEDQSETKEQE